jgi:hypothetical protein
MLNARLLTYTDGMASLPPIHKATGLYLTWIGVLCGAVLLLLGNLLPYPVPFATPGNFFLCIVELEVFFALLVWPLFVPALLKDGAQGLPLLSYVAVLILFALPLVLIGANVSSVDAAVLVRTQALVAGLAALGGGVAARKPERMPWYLLGVFWLSTAPPLWTYLSREMGARAPAVSVYASPFWGAAVEAGGPAWVQAGVAGAAGLILLARKGAA